MNAYHPSLTATLASERRNDLLRAAARSQLIADLADRGRHASPHNRAPWWTRVTSRRVMASGA